MNFTIKVKLTASSKLLDAIKLLAGGIALPEPKEFIPAGDPPAVVEQSSIQKATATKTRKVKDEVKEDPKPEVKEPIEEPVKDEFKDGEGVAQPTIEDVRAAVQEKAAGGKRDEVKALLTKYKVARVTDLVESDYSPFLKEVKAINLEKVKA